MTTILRRYTGAVLYTSELPLREAAEAAVRSGVDLTEADLTEAYLDGANLGGANLGGASLTRANLRGANLYRANLRGANLRGANLRGADLYRANLGGADLYGANLGGADLYGADLYGANLYRANLTEANLTRANLDEANLTEADLRDLLMPDAPPVEELRASVADHIEAHPELHDQSQWGDGSASPACETPCCVAGRACHLGGGDRGLSVQTAALLLLWHKDLPMPDFSGDTSREDILEALRARAET